MSHCDINYIIFIAIYTSNIPKTIKALIVSVEFALLSFSKNVWVFFFNFSSSSIKSLTRVRSFTIFRLSNKYAKKNNVAANESILSIVKIVPTADNAARIMLTVISTINVILSLFVINFLKSKFIFHLNN